MLKLLVLSSALLISSVALADTYQASQLYHQQHYQQAKAEFELLLPLGNATAAFNLAVMAMNGQGMDQNMPLAYSYFSLAAELGHPNALTGIQTLDSRLSDEQKQQAQEQAKLWHSQAVPSYASMQQQKNCTTSKRQQQRNYSAGGTQISHKCSAQRYSGFRVCSVTD
jgi:TPR repeat protein